MKNFQAIVLSKENQGTAKSVGSSVISMGAMFQSSNVEADISTLYYTSHFTCDHHIDRNCRLFYLQSEISILLGYYAGLYNNPKLMF